MALNALLPHLALATLTLGALISPAATEATDVVMPTQDGKEVHGTLKMPKRDSSDPVPAVLLVHGGRKSKREWAPLMPALKDSGFAVLAIDLRGHGSTGGEIEDWNSFFSDPTGVPHDVKAAMDFLKENESVDKDRIAVVGSSVGANLACVAVEKYGALGGVAMSGKTEAAESLAGEKLTALKSMLYIAGELEQDGKRADYARELNSMSAGSSRALIVPDSSAHGAELLAEDPALVRDVVAHLRGILANGKFQQVEFPAQDDLTITADMYDPNPPTSPWIVVAHQAGWSRGEYRETAPRLNALGFNVLALDQRSGGEINGVLNETAKRAGEKSLPTEYLDAEGDIVAGLRWVRQFKPEKVILVGSSYSASLSLKIAGEHPDLMDAIASFSPGEYFGRSRPKLIETVSAKVKCPAFISSAKREAPQWEPFLNAIPAKLGEGKWSYVPKVAGQHGSRALWSANKGHRALWVAFNKFLLAQR